MSIKKYYKYNEKAENTKKIRKIILFVSVSIFVMIFSAVLAQKIFMMSKEVQASSDVKRTSSDAEEGSKNAKDVLLKNHPTADDVAFVEKYLSQQYDGIKPDGADGRKIAYLTFDDGPSETVTPKVLDALKAENVKATFFIIGKELEKSDIAKDLLKREVAEGNAIGNHTYSHDYKYLYPNKTISVENFMEDIEKTNKLFKSVLGDEFYTRAIRFPGGHMSWKDIKAMDDMMTSKDYHQVDWNSLSKDAEGKFKKAPELLNEFINTVKGREKAVILMHDTYGKEETAKALPEIIKYLKEQGYEFKTMK